MSGHIARDLDPPNPNDNTTLLEVIGSYERAGYTGDFAVDTDSHVRCRACHGRLDARTLDDVSLRRLEGASDPADMLAVVALRCPVCGTRGLLVVNFGPEATLEQAQVLLALSDERGTADLPEAQTPDEAEASRTSPDTPPDS